MRTDFHCHILPHLDDGAESVEMSLAMLRAEQEQGVSRVVLTPHFDGSRERIDAFLKRRRQSAALLAAAVAEDDLSHLLIGTETAMSGLLQYEGSLESLCICDSGTLLLELPYTPMDDSWFSMLEMLSHHDGIRIVLSHVEHYRDIWGKAAFEQVMALPVYKQINCASVYAGSLRRRRLTMELIADRRVHVLGTNACNCTLQPVNYQNAEKRLTEKGLSYQLAEMMENAVMLTERGG